MARSHLSHEDEDDLLWWLSLGQVMFERSAMGAMLDRASLYGFALGEADKHLDPVEGRLTRVRWRGVQVTARTTSEHRSNKQFVPPDDPLKRAAAMGRRLRAVGKLDMMSAAVLTLYFGERGNRYDIEGAKPGRIFSVYICTDAASELLDRDMAEIRKRQNGKPGELPLPPYRRLEIQASHEWGRPVLGYKCGYDLGDGVCKLLPDHLGKHNREKVTQPRKQWRRHMLNACELQARKLLIRAATVWNRA